MDYTENQTTALLDAPPDSSTSNKVPTPMRRRPRKPISCQSCRQSKLRCDRQSPCATCKRRNCVSSCIYANGKGIPPIVRLLNSPSSTIRGESAIPHSLPHLLSQQPGIGIISEPHLPLEANQERQDVTYARWDAILQRPTDQADRPALNQYDPFSRSGNICFPFPLGNSLSMAELLRILPPNHCCEYFITQYFMHLSPLFHILHGPTFQKQYQAFRENPSKVDLSWLALLFSVCAATVQTMEDDDIVLEDLWPKETATRDTEALSYQYRVAAMLCLSKDNFLFRHHLNTLEGLLLLGIALNIGIALRCNVQIQTRPETLNFIEIERRRRCWAGILLLHTNQAISFKDIDMSFLLDIKATMPTDVNDIDITEEAVMQPSSQPTQMSVMRFKIQLFQLSSRICRHLLSQPYMNEETLDTLDAAVAREQSQWDSTFLLEGNPSILDTSNYAHWCILQLYAHQLYLLLHRPFCHKQSSSGSRFRQSSQAKCISSGAALLDLHQKFFELPRLRHYRWYVYGMTSFYALHGAVALASCLLDKDDETFDSTSYRASFDASIARFDLLQSRSAICTKAYPILSHLQSMMSPGQFKWSTPVDYQFRNNFDDWIDAVQWLNPDSVNWVSNLPDE
ncbi:hypothetical protein N7495_005551 [Penicillium taxi]|uniref:uncharacterized protein n=1 Tax=Penicillium taxi TaxID=168475 RepID=UPI002545B394|nr:uncharacterized protein N7495_005551 [Penicillium taxi]KAJ5893860.1 hypothetical protein N7495_005551 [Penicillium taxi]